MLTVKAVQGRTIDRGQRPVVGKPLDEIGIGDERGPEANEI